MVMKDIGHSYLHLSLVVVLGTMSTGDHRVDWSAYFKLVPFNGKDLKESHRWFQLTKPYNDE